MKNFLYFTIMLIITSCSKAVQPPPEPPKKDYGYVLFVSHGADGEWQLVDSDGKRLFPTNLSPALKVHKLRVYFSYEELSQREDGVIVVRLVSIAIE